MTVLPSSNTSRTAPALHSSVKCRRARCTFLPGSMIAIVSACRGVSTKADQAHIPFVSGSISVIAGARNPLRANRSLGFCFEIRI